MTRTNGARLLSFHLSPMRSSMVNQIWTSIADAGRDLLRGRLSGRRRGIEALCRDLLSTRGEASGAALAREVVETFRALPDAERLAFFELLAQGFDQNITTLRIVS